ncbi:MAG: phosphate/phosphite/phosphonate ABC transporter substrate-binding protein [Acidimicrobiia bacterium]|jgi:phosphonate transport system substrate-binding protein|nr:phosphate/phosphite/phosphonate ABC transporter substrate-binding protein [Acidimicrobiia bacterium]
MTLVLVAAACGGDDTTETSGGAEETTETSDAGGDATEETTEASEGEGGGDLGIDTLTFAAVPSEESSALQESYEPIIAAIEDELGVTVEFIQATDYAGVIEAMIAGDVDLAQFGPFSYVIARNNGAEIDAIAALIEEEGAEPGYQSFGITASTNTDINSLADFAGRTVCFVDPGSTSGFLYPSAGLIEEGVIASASEADLAAGLGEAIFAGGHDASALSVANGDCEAGFAFDDMVEGLVDGQLEEGALRVVWESEVIAGSPVAVSTQLPEAAQERIEELFTEFINTPSLVENGYCESEDTCGITDENAYGYAAVDDSFYDGVRAVCETTEAEACREA